MTSFLPTYRYTPAITEALAELERLRAGMAELTPDLARLAALRRAAWARRTAAAGTLDGLAIMPGEAARLLGGGLGGGSATAAVRGYALALDQIAGDWPAEREPAALPVLAGLHFFLIHTPEHRGPLPGLRRGPTALADWRDGAPLAFAPAPAEVRPALQELMGWLHAARSAVAPAIRAGVAYARLLAIQPQETANARTACAYTALLLHRAALLPHGLPGLEAAFVADPDRYHAALLAVGPLDDAAPVVTAWLEYFLAVLRDELRAAYSSLRTATLPAELHAPAVAASDSPPPLRLNPRQRRIVELLTVSGATLANSECQTLFDVSAMTAARDLRELVDRGLIRMYGQGRATYYGGGQGPGVRGQESSGGAQESAGSAALTAAHSQPPEAVSGENKGSTHV